MKRKTILKQIFSAITVLLILSSFYCGEDENVKKTKQKKKASYKQAQSCQSKCVSICENKKIKDEKQFVEELENENVSTANGDYNSQGQTAAKTATVVPFDEGKCSGDCKKGKATMTFDNGAVYEGEFKDGLPNGKGKLTFKDGTYYEGSWKNGLYDGEGKYVTQVLYKYIGQWKNGLRHGKGKMYYADGRIYNGYWKNDKRNGTGAMLTADGYLITGVWENDNRIELKSKKKYKKKNKKKKSQKKKIESQKTSSKK